LGLAQTALELSGMTDDPATLRDDRAPVWRADIDALAFWLEQHGGACMVHRHAFRTLLRRTPGTEDCLAFYRDHRAAFHAAAAAKLQRGGVTEHATFHLTSRDLRRQMAK
jgi:hypothetical protein